jgi:holo-[acyl-carrier protein] synthase
MTTPSAFSWIDVAAPDALVAGSVRAGVDRVELDEFQRTIDVAGDPFVERIFTREEIAFCHGRVDRLATRFAAKEAVAKILGTGIRGLGWLDIEVVSTPAGEPRLRLHGRALNRASALGVTSLALSLVHTSRTAEAFVVALCCNSNSEESLKEEINHALRFTQEHGRGK